MNTLPSTQQLRGITSVVAWRGERPVGYTWMWFMIDPDLGFLPIRLPPGAAYAGHFFVEPRSRAAGRGAAPVARRNQLARTLAISEVWRIIAPDNVASRRAVAKATVGGIRETAEVRFVRVGGWAWVRLKPRAIQ